MAFSTFSSINNLISKKKSGASGVQYTKQTFTVSGVSSLPFQGAYDISDDGTVIAVVNTSYQLYMSTNSGSSFSLKGTFPGTIYDFYMSNSGTNIIAVGSNVVYTSTNSGQSFSTIAASGIMNVSISGNGQYAGYLINTSGFYVSTNSMSSFTQTLIASNCYSCSIDRNNPTNMICSVNSSGSYLQLYISTNYGASFTLNTYTSNPHPYGRGCNINGSSISIISASANPQVVLTSNNTGQSFTQWSSTVCNQVLQTQGNHNVCMNSTSTLAYFIYRFSPYSLLYSADNGQTSTAIFATSNGTDKAIRASSDCKYILGWSGSALSVTTNNYI